MAEPLDEIIQIASSTEPLLERARCVVETLHRWLPVEAVCLTLSDPDANTYATVDSTGPERLVPYRDDRSPINVTERPEPGDDPPPGAECRTPARFRDGIGVPVVEPGGAYLGMLSLLLSNPEPLSLSVREGLAHLAPVIARAVSPMRSLLATARLVQGARCGAVLLSDGTTYRLPGLADHPLLVRGSPVALIARDALRDGQVYRSFLWPVGDGSPDHLRVTALVATDVPAFVLGTLLVTPEADCRGLTPRELEVLGQLVAGRSNQQVANRLAITPRTVATHVEHILTKLDVPTRTEAAVRAERDGCYVPARTWPRARPKT